MNAVAMAQKASVTEARSLDLGIPACHPLAPFVTEAMEEPTFMQQWPSPGDPSFRPYAVASLTLWGVGQLDFASRQTFYRSIATQKRREVLSSVSNRQVPERMLKLIAKTDWQRFELQDWMSLINLEGGNDEVCLGHVRCITPELIRQFNLNPELLREKGFLEVIAELTISADRWKEWAQFIKKESANNRVSIKNMAHSTTTRGDVWDLYFWCQGRNRRPFDLPYGVEDGRLIEPLRSSNDMVQESKRMVNCLDKRISRVWSGNRIYFKGRNGMGFDAELVRHALSWIPGDILGPSNQQVAPAIEAEVRKELATLAEKLNQSTLSATQADFDKHVPDETGIAIPQELMEEVCNALQTIKGRSLSWTQGAYAIFENSDGYYVQALSSPDGTEYLVEIASHEYVSSLNERLTDEVVEFIEKSRFVWPQGRSNFHRWFSIFENENFQDLAELLMTAMTKIFGHFEWEDLEVKTHVPS